MSKDNKKNLKDKLESLKDINNANHVEIDTSQLYAEKDEFPTGRDNIESVEDDERYIDYDQQKENFKNIATQTVDNIIKTYIKNDKLLNSSRLKDLKNYDIVKYSRLLLLADNTERNMLMIQESIDLGDLSKEMFDSVNKTQNELRKNMDELDKHLSKMEDYWKEYASKYGYENEEEKIVNEDTTTKDDSNIIVDQTSLIENIHKKINEDKKKKAKN